MPSAHSKISESTLFSFFQSGCTSRLPEFEAEKDVIESPAQVPPEHSTRTPLALTEVPDDTQQATHMAVADLLCQAPLDPDEIASDDDSCTYTTRVIAVAECRLMLPSLPLTPPRGPRLASPPDRERGLCTSPEKYPSSGTMVKYQPTATVPKKGRVGTATPWMVTTEADYDRIDRGVGPWPGSCWNRIGLIPCKSHYQLMTAPRRSGNTLLDTHQIIYYG